MTCSELGDVGGVKAPSKGVEVRAEVLVAGAFRGDFRVAVVSSKVEIAPVGTLGLPSQLRTSVKQRRTWHVPTVPGP